MRVEQSLWTQPGGWEPAVGGLGASAQVVLVFGGTELVKEGSGMDEVRAAYPQAHIIGCSTAGEICGTRVREDTLVATAIHFEHTSVAFARETVGDIAQSFPVGKRLAETLLKDDLAHVFILSDGLRINGSDLVRGLTSRLPTHVSVTGGLAGDGSRFRETYVLWNGRPERDIVAAIGFYGSRLKVGYGSVGGWDPFGPERVVTRAKGNVLYEMDGKSALGLYKTYLGDQAKDLPASGLLFPLSLHTDKDDRPVVRTLLSINEADQSMTFAGDVPEGMFARLMKANFDRLIDGAVEAAKLSYAILDAMSPDLAILISCVGRKLILKQRIEEEVEGVQEILGAQTPLAGFYSYGEICPFTRGARCELHNQTMTITALSER
jgi:hypothetical protein